MLKNAIILILIIFAVAAFFAYRKTQKIESLIVAQNGFVSGEFSIESVMALDRPYECLFTKSDQTSRINGVVRTAEGKLRGDFDIETVSDDPAKKLSFASHMIITEGQIYNWTSLGTVGYQRAAAESTSKTSSAADQAQIIGIKDKFHYDCSPWNAILNAFDLPSGIKFVPSQ